MQAGLFILFIYFFVTWRCVACSVYGALGWDPCSVYSVSSFFYWALGLDVCGAFQRL